MARIRSVKPTIWDSEQFANVSIEARLTFIGLITQADDEGRIKTTARRVKAVLFAYDSMTVERVDGWLTELSNEGLIVRYENAGTEYIALPTWSKHQKINRATDSALPSHSDPDSVITHGSLTEDSRGKGREGKGEEGKGEGKEPTDTAVGDISSDDVRDVFDYWAQQLNKPRAKLTDTRRDKIRTRLKEGTTVEEMRAAIDGCAASEFHVTNGHTDLELILRSRENVEKFIDRGRASGPRTAEQRGMDNARMWAAEAERLEALERQEAA